VCAQCPGRLEEDLGSLGNGITDDCEPPVECWESYPGPPKKKKKNQVLLAVGLLSRHCSIQLLRCCWGIKLRSLDLCNSALPVGPYPQLLVSLSALGPWLAATQNQAHGLQFANMDNPGKLDPMSVAVSVLTACVVSTQPPAALT
jgi:hypothetical protein